MTRYVAHRALEVRAECRRRFRDERAARASRATDGVDAAGGAGGGAAAVGTPGGAVRGTTDMRGTEPVIHLSGWVQPHDSATAQLAIRDPASTWLHAFAEALSDRGIKIDGGVVRTPDADVAEQQRLASITSPTLAEIMPAFFKPSQNQIGEILLHTLGLEKEMLGTSDAGRARGRAADGRLRRRHRRASSCATAADCRDTTTSRRETIVRILDGMRQRAGFQGVLRRDADRRRRRHDRESDERDAGAGQRPREDWNGRSLARVVRATSRPPTAACCCSRSSATTTRCRTPRSNACRTGSRRSSPVIPSCDEMPSL